jgi:hypothetical protein
MSNAQYYGSPAPEGYAQGPPQGGGYGHGQQGGYPQQQQQQGYGPPQPVCEIPHSNSGICEAIYRTSANTLPQGILSSRTTELWSSTTATGSHSPSNTISPLHRTNRMHAVRRRLTQSQMQYQQAQRPPKKSSGAGKGCLGGCLAVLCCCCVAEEGCEACADCAGKKYFSLTMGQNEDC